MNCQLRGVALAQIPTASTRIAELQKLESTSRDHLVPRSHSDHGHLELRAMASWVLSSSRGQDSTISLCSLFLCLTMLKVKMFLEWDFFYFYLFPKLLVLSLSTNERSLALSSFPPPLVLLLGTKEKWLALPLLL